MIARKLDADQIRAFLQKLAREDWVQRSERHEWPHSLFHYTDIENAVRILQDNCLYSRSHLEVMDRHFVDGASARVLATTAKPIKEYVRLYFRPKTPTQWHVEGIRSSATLSKLNAHCPTMIFFVFDAAEILTRADCRFSDGNLASTWAQVLSTAAELEALPWRHIYHVGSFNPHDPSQTAITFRRCAEVIVPKRLDLSSLRAIYCRSDAEKETLLYLLSPADRRRYQNLVVSSTRNMLFFRLHAFVERVDLTANDTTFHFSPDTRSSGPFHLIAELVEHGVVRRYEDRDATLTGEPIKLSINPPSSSYSVRLTLDDHLAYANNYDDLGIPF